MPGKILSTSTADSRDCVRPYPVHTVRDIRSFLKRNPLNVNPYDLLQLALEFLVNMELKPESGAVLVSEILEGFQAVAMTGVGREHPVNMMQDIIRLQILEPADWRQSLVFEQWRRRLSEGFHDS